MPFLFTRLRRWLLACTVIYTAASLPGRPPNIVFILADDLGWRDLGNEGSTFYDTPHLDRLAREGAKFTRGYAASRVCSPSRASILTGQYPARHGITDWIGAATGDAWRNLQRFTPSLPADYVHALPADAVTLAEALQGAGYATGFVGKWHLGDTPADAPTAHGFDLNRGGWGAGSPRGGFFSPYDNPALTDGPPGESLPLRLAQETNAFIAAHQEKPFFAYLSFYSVHSPLETTPELWKKYRDRAVAAGLTPEGERFIWDRTLSVRQVQDCPIYAGMIEAMDNAVSLVLAQLDELGLAENTIVCFTSDNGGVSSGDAFATSNLPLRGGKGRQWEGGTREPFFLKAPGIARPGLAFDTPVSGIDWYPTLLELAGVSLPAGHVIDGVSLVPLLQGRPLPARPLYWHYPHYGNQGGEPSSIITQDDWKLIHYHEDGRDELYHLATDPGEQYDVATTQPARARGLRAQLDAWLASTGASMATPDPQYDPARRAAWLERARTEGQTRLERQHAGFLDADYQPDPTWWGSVPRD